MTIEEQLLIAIGVSFVVASVAMIILETRLRRLRHKQKSGGK